MNMSVVCRQISDYPSGRSLVERAKRGGLGETHMKSFVASVDVILGSPDEKVRTK